MSPSHVQHRRRFLRDSLLVSTGVAGGMMSPAIMRALSDREVVAAGPDSGSAERRLRELGITLPPAPRPVAVYVPATTAGDILYTSGHGPRRADGTSFVGKVGSDLTLDEGYQAARQVGLNVLSTVRNSLGSLDKVVRLLKVLGMVNCTADFKQQPQVINGFSELMVDVFGEQAGKGARSAVGMGSLPSGIAVEIEAIFQVRG